MHDDSNQQSAPLGQSVGLLMSLDVGSRTIGLTVSHPLGITAQGLPTIRRVSKRADLQQLANLIREYQGAEIVIGYPLHMSGEAGAQAQKVEGLATEMRSGYPITISATWYSRIKFASCCRSAQS